MGELLIILVIVMVVFGASKLPQVGQGLGAAIRNFKRAASGDGDDDALDGAKAALDGPRVKALGAGSDRAAPGA